jgi:uncharacterized glyoxalase superfamily protein PhnB
MSLHPYLTFSGTTRQAMSRYHEIFGGRLDVMTFGDIPEGEAFPHRRAARSCPDHPDHRCRRCRSRW